MTILKLCVNLRIGAEADLIRKDIIYMKLLTLVYIEYLSVSSGKSVVELHNLPKDELEKLASDKWNAEEFLLSSGRAIEDEGQKEASSNTYNFNELLMIALMCLSIRDTVKTKAPLLRFWSFLITMLTVNTLGLIRVYSNFKLGMEVLPYGIAFKAFLIGFVVSRIVGMYYYIVSSRHLKKCCEDEANDYVQEQFQGKLYGKDCKLTFRCEKPFWLALMRNELISACEIELEN